MRYRIIYLFIVISFISFNLNAQTNNELEIRKENSRARVENVKGQKVLVLKTGRKTLSTNYSNYSNDIVLAIDTNTWTVLDSLVNAPWGSSVKLKDIDGYKVDVAKANVNSKVGLMFTSGSKCVAITKEEYEALKQ